MKFGLLYEIEKLQPWDADSQRNAFQEALEQIKLAEEVGFDYVWEVEHHFLGEFSISSAPEVFLAAVSQHTSRIRIGPGAEWYVNATNMLYAIWAQAGAQSYQWYAEQFEKGRAGADVDIARMADESILCIGGPERCEQIARHYEAQGIDQLIFLVQAGGTPHEAIMESLRRFGEQVLPQFQEAKASA